MKEYEVGQILFLANEKNFKIIPVQVVEEVIRTTIDGQFKTYLVKFPNKDRSVVDIAEVKFKLFKNENAVKEYLLDNTKKAIDELLKSANVIKKEIFGDNSRIDNSNNLDNALKNISVQQEKKGDIIKIDLGNGQTGNLKIDDLPKEK